MCVSAGLRRRLLRARGRWPSGKTALVNGVKGTGCPSFTSHAPPCSKTTVFGSLCGFHHRNANDGTDSDRPRLGKRMTTDPFPLKIYIHISPFMPLVSPHCGVPHPTVKPNHRVEFGRPPRFLRIGAAWAFGFIAVASGRRHSTGGSSCSKPKEIAAKTVKEIRQVVRIICEQPAANRLGQASGA